MELTFCGGCGIERDSELKKSIYSVSVGNKSFGE